MRHPTTALAVAALLALSGCASIMEKSSYPVNVSSTPDGASFTITNRAGKVITQGITPNSVTLKASAGFFKGEKYTINFHKPGYEPQTFVLDSGISGFYFAGNLLFGGLVGWLIVDPATGKMFTLPNSAAVTLNPLQNTIEQSVNPDQVSLKIISVDQLTEAQKRQLQPLAEK
ncbi:hypothetical protein [Neisseria sp.]|uniref:hypothetical protein n=1 Tax=Neisseria sp. TaxID=192066 RepID=UPI0035A0743D